MVDNKEEIAKLSDRERFCLDGYIMNKDKRFAFICSRRRPLKAEFGDSFNVSLSRWFNGKPVQEYIKQHEVAEVAKQFKQAADAPENEISKQELLQQLTILFRSERETKLKSELALKIADLQSWKKQEVAEKEEQRHFYSPLKCSTCKTLLSVTNCANCIHTFQNKNPQNG